MTKDKKNSAFVTMGWSFSLGQWRWLRHTLQFSPAASKQIVVNSCSCTASKHLSRL